MRRTTEEVDVLKQEIDQIASDISILEEDLQDESIQEKIIRDELLLQKPGEYVVQLPALEGILAENAPEPTPKPLEAWRQLLFE